MRPAQFTLNESKPIWKRLEDIANRSHHKPSQAFSDFLTMSVCCLAVQRMEAKYLETIKPYTKGEQGKRAIDIFPIAFAELVNAMEATSDDIIGDIFQGAVTYGENGQFFTPMSICRLMAETSLIGLTSSGKSTDDILRIQDPACGSGRTLLCTRNKLAEMGYRRCHLYGVDVDIRCVQMTLINLMLNGATGYVVHGNTLTMELWEAFYFSPYTGIKNVDPESVLTEPSQPPLATSKHAVAQPHKIGILDGTGTITIE